jgi:4-diphosphocytidyl-2-C-methyl-D-erythritol kinase
MRRLPATAKLNLALVVGPRGADGRHELTTVLQRIDLADRIAVEPAARLRVTGFAADTLVREALLTLAEEARTSPAWHARIEKRIPVAAGLAGGSSDAATALRLANETLPEPRPCQVLERIAGSLGADVPFFLRPGPQLGERDGTHLTALDLPQDFWVVVVLPRAVRKASTGDVYRAFDARRGGEGYDERREALLATLASVRRPRDVARLPPNDLASSPLSEELRELGAFRADVTGAGPAVYGLFHHERPAAAAARQLRHFGRTWLTVPTWYF